MKERRHAGATHSFRLTMIAAEIVDNINHPRRQEGRAARLAKPSSGTSPDQRIKRALRISVSRENGGWIDMTSSRMLKVSLHPLLGGAELELGSADPGLLVYK